MADMRYRVEIALGVAGASVVSIATAIRDGLVPAADRSFDWSEADFPRPGPSRRRQARSRADRCPGRRGLHPCRSMPPRNRTMIRWSSALVGDRSPPVPP
jgi:hypothetical protein